MKLPIQQEHLKNELNILSIIQHPFITNFQGMTSDAQYVYIGFDMIPGGDLFQKKELKNIPFYIAQVAIILDYLHSKSIIHRDIKPENIYLGADGYIKLVDFQFAKHMVHSDFTQTLCGTPEYMAPEIISGMSYKRSVDWWSLGILLYEMIEGQTPFADDDSYQIYKKVTQAKIKYSKAFSLSSRSLCKKLLQRDPLQRMKEFKKELEIEQFFSEIEWPSIRSKKMNAPYIPNIKGPNDVSQFPIYPESDSVAEAIEPQNDPFYNW